MKLLRIFAALLLVAAGILIGFGYGRWFGPKPAEQAIKLPKPKGYHCPMHPNFRSDKPGDCGICGMKLVPDDDATEGAAAHNHDMHEMPAGAIYVPAAKQQLIGVKFAVAEMTAADHGFRAVGKVTVDETRVAKVQPRIEGWVDQVFADFTGKMVTKGQPLLTIYSPEMLASQQELLLALRSREILKRSPLEEAGPQGESLVLAARKRLHLFDLSDAQIDEVIRTGKPITNITLYSPVTGYIMMRNAFPKQRITPSTELYTIVDHAKVWIMADVFENESDSISMGMPVTISLPYGPGRKLPGQVSYVQPEVDAATRTLKIRIEAENPNHALKPDMFVDVDFRVRRTPQVTVPAEAVLDSGLKKTVFVDLGEGYLEPRQVETGDRMEDRVTIVKGLKAGERIVVSGNFLIDSESQLKSAAAGMSGHQHD